MGEQGKAAVFTGPGEDAGSPAGDAAGPDGAALLRAISDTSEDVIYAKDRQGRMLFANPAALALIGKPLAEVIGRTDLETLDDRAAARAVMENDRRIMESGVAEDVEERVPLPGGAERIWLSRKVPYRDAVGNVIGLLGISRDVTERRRAEAALRASEERYRTLFTNMTEGFALGEAIVDPDGVARDFRFLEMNDAFGVQSGLDPETTRGRPMREVLPQLEQTWVDVYCGVALGAPACRFESHNRDLGRTFGVHCFRPSPGRFAILFEDVTERLRTEASLREANEQLREADRRKDEFLGMLSHELRNPLTPIRNGVFVLERAEPGSERARRAREVIGRQAEHLTRLVDDLLDVTRIARGKIELRRERVDLAELVRRTADDLRSTLEGQGVALELRLPGRPVPLDGDATRLAQVTGNLLHNASKFTPPGGTVTVAVDETDGRAELAVHDTGVGLEPELLARVFEPFVQGERSLARTKGGLGLGLALVKAIVELHGGTVEARSDGPGLGAEFRATFPALAAR